MTHVPLIAITGRLSDTAHNVRGEAFASGQRYSRAIGRAGGQPVILPPVAETYERFLTSLRRMDALVLHGGGDVDPRRYGEEISAEQVYGIVPEHDELEFALVRAALDLDIPVLAICRGLQVLNVALGGTLHQDIGNEDHWHTHHPVDVTPGSLLAKALGTDRPEACASVHHQALKDVAPALEIVGRAVDGTVEGVELTSARWVVGVQWHPEDTAATDPVQQSLFDALVQATLPAS
jgi:putative glutamine amidotransferase